MSSTDPTNTSTSSSTTTTTNTTKTPNKNRVVLLEAKGLKRGTVISGRVGRTGSTWDEKGSNDGATSEPSQGSTSRIGWLVINPFERDDPLELSLRLIVGGSSNSSSSSSLLSSSASGVIAASKKKNLLGEATVSMNTNHAVIAIKKGGSVAGTIKASFGDSLSLLTDARVEASLRTYPCGTNHFGMDKSLELNVRSDLNDCVIWGETHVPMKSWVTVHFLYHDVPYQDGASLVRSSTLWKRKVKKKSDDDSDDNDGNGGYANQRDWKGDEVEGHGAGAKSGYGAAGSPDHLTSNAVPMLEVMNHKNTDKNNDGSSFSEIVCDGVIINKITIPLLWGPDKMTERVLHWERKIGYEFIPAMWREYTANDYSHIFSRTMRNSPWMFRMRYSPMIKNWRKVMLAEMSTIQSYIGEEFVLDKARTMEDIFKEFKEEIGNSTFVGGELPNPTDLSFFGANVLHYLTDIGPARRLMIELGLSDWMESMIEILPPAKVLPMSAFGPSMDGWNGGWLLDPPQFDPVRSGANI